MLVFGQSKTVRITSKKTLELPEKVAETSGLEAWNGWIFTHNDSGNKAFLYALDPKDGKILHEWKLPVRNRDFEDITQDSTYFYVADVGNNYNVRTHLNIYRVEKKPLLQNKIAIDSISFHWPSVKSDSTKFINYNCEALVASGDSLFLFTKEKHRTAVFSIPKVPGHHVARYKSEFRQKNFFATGAYFNESLHRLVLCGYDNQLRTFILDFSNFQSTNFFSAKVQKYRFTKSFRQTEGITSFNGYDFYLSNERFHLPLLVNKKQQLHKIKLPKLPRTD